MLYTITLQDIELRAYHGCYDLEQKVGNRFLVDLNITPSLAPWPMRMRWRRL